MYIEVLFLWTTRDSTFYSISHFIQMLIYSLATTYQKVYELKFQFIKQNKYLNEQIESKGI